MVVMRVNSVSLRGGQNPSLFYTHSPYTLCTVHDDSVSNDRSQDHSTHSQIPEDNALDHALSQHSPLASPFAEMAVSHTHGTPTTPRAKPSSAPRVQMRHRRSEHSIRGQRQSSLSTATLLSSPVTSSALLTSHEAAVPNCGSAMPAPMLCGNESCVTPAPYSGSGYGSYNNNNNNNNNRSISNHHHDHECDQNNLLSCSGNNSHTTGNQCGDARWFRGGETASMHLRNGESIAENGLSDAPQVPNHPLVLPERPCSQSIATPVDALVDDSTMMEFQARRESSSSYGRRTPWNLTPRNMCRPVSSLPSNVGRAYMSSKPASTNRNGNDSRGHYNPVSLLGCCDKEPPASAQAAPPPPQQAGCPSSNYHHVPSYPVKQSFVDKNSTSGNRNYNNSTTSLAFSQQDSMAACGMNVATSRNAMPSSAPVHFLNDIRGDVLHSGKGKNSYNANNDGRTRHYDAQVENSNGQPSGHHGRYSHLHADDSTSVSSQTSSSMSSIRDNLPLCADDQNCSLVNNHKHQRQYAHTCRLFPCYHGHIKRHASIFRHVEGQLAQHEGVHTNKITTQALASVNFSSISPEARNAYRIYVSHGSMMYEIFGDWASVKVHTFKRYLHQVYHIAPHAQILVLMKTKKVMDDDISSVKSYGVEVDSIVQLQLDMETYSLANLLDEL